MDKQELIKAIEEMPEDIQIFICPMVYDAVDIRIFTVPKDEKFINWYFGP